MSSDVNTRLLERAANAIDACTGTLYEDIIIADIDRNDLESLRVHVKQAEDWIYSQNYNPEPNDLTDAEIAQIASQPFTGRTDDVF